jgi:hypothetical protein
MSEVGNLNDTSPAAPANARNAKWQKGAQTGTDPASGYPIYPISNYQTDMVGDTGSGGADGLVPAPPSGSAAAGKYLKADATWEIPPGGVGVVGITIDGSGSVPTTGTRGFIQIPYAGTITDWTLIADQSGSASVDVWAIAGSAPPTAPSVPTSANKISASAPVALSSAQSASGGTSAISTWTTALTQWMTVAFNLTSVTTCTRITIELQVAKS